MSLDLKNLNKEQKEAVVHDEGPLLIVAGAGTGKTTVITQRIVYLIEQQKAKPEEILAVTFTDKAAGEMEERVDKLLDYGYTDLWISTFHAFCERVLRDHALDIGLPADFKVLDGTSNWLLLRQNLDKFDLDYYRPLGNPTKFLQALISHFSHCKDQEIYPQDYLEYADKLKTRDDMPENGEVERIKEIANAYHVYQRLLLENSALDFGDLINYCLKLFKERPQILKQYQEKFKYILVDEFQDTNWSQYELIKLLAAPKNNLTVCADDDQAIYRWRGASFNNIIQFKKDFPLNGPGPSGHRPEAKEVALVQNYRSAQNILDLSYTFIKQNDPDRLEFVNKINKKLIANNGIDGTVQHIHAKSLEEEVSKVIKTILDTLKKDEDATYNDFAILVRANDAANPFIKALERAGLPYQFLASRGLYSRPVVLDTIAYLKLLDNYHESTALYRILNLPFLKIPAGDIMQLLHHGHKKTKSLFETAEELALVPGISKAGQQKINFVLELIKKHTAFVHEKSVHEITLLFFEESGYAKYLADNNNEEAFDLMNQFLRRIKTFEESTIEPTLKNFMSELTLEIEAGEEGKLEFDPEAGPDMIKVMTIHGAKGLEFKYVFLVNMVDKRFPTIERKDLIDLPDDLIKDIKPTGDVHLQEERRICYVAMTRAKQGLYFTSGEDYGGARKKRLSRFLVEMGYKDEVESSKLKVKRSDKFFEPKPEILNRKSEISYVPDHFSYSQLAAFEKCPLQYKYAFILKVPVRGKAVFSFGKTMHATLEQFLRAANDNGKNQDNLFGFKEPLDATQSKKSIDLKFINDLYDKNWIDDWYENKQQKEEYYRLGKKIIKEFYENFENNPPKILKTTDGIALELPFNLKVGDNTLYGVIDRIDEIKDGIRIVDYKTGQAKEKLDADAKEQLLIYQIAAQEIFKLNPKELTYFYVNDGKEMSFLGRDEELAKLKEKIIKEIEQIKASKFDPTPGWQCAYCDFKDICDYAQR